jgi:hypothetical protein
LSFPVPGGRDTLDAYVVYIGFDDLGDRERRPAPAKKSAPKAKQPPPERNRQSF